MRADAVDLDLFGTPIRVICEDGHGRSAIREILSSHLIDEPAPTGFMIKPPEGPGGFYLLTDRSGFVLARARTLDQCLGSLGSHLGAFAPSNPSGVRFRARTLTGDEGDVALACFPIFAVPAPVASRLARHGYGLVDRLTVEVYEDGSVRHTRPPWSEFESLGLPKGHRDLLEEPVTPARLLLPRRTVAKPSHAELVAFIASLMTGPVRSTLIDRAELLAELRITSLGSTDEAGWYRALGAG